MAEAAQKLPSDPKKLHAIIAQMAAEKVEREQRFEAELQAREAELRTRNETIEKLDRKIELLLERLELLRHQRFGPKADRISKDQLALFDEAELNVLLEELDAQIAEAKAPHSPRTEPKQTPKRKPLPAHLPRVERILDLPEAEQAAIAATHVRIGFDESEQLGVLPKQYYVIKIKRAKYAPIHATFQKGKQVSASRRARRRSCPRHGAQLAARRGGHRQVRRWPAAVPPGEDLRPRGHRALPPDAVRLDRATGHPAGPGAGGVEAAPHPRPGAADRRDSGAGVG
jgi:transposase